MIVLKTKADLAKMQDAGRISAQALAVGGELVRPGVTTKEIDTAIHKFILSQGAVPSFLGYGGFPASACVSVNEEVIHGIPGNRVLLEGDVVSIDVGAIYNGYHGDNAFTFTCGAIGADVEQLLTATKESLYKGIAAAVDGNRIGDVSSAVASHIDSFGRGYGIVREYVGHGIGTEMHEEPEVPNYGKAGHGVRLRSGMTIAIEPMINLAGAEVYVAKDRWTVLTKSGSPSAHFEHTVAITDNGPMILTLP